VGVYLSQMGARATGLTPPHPTQPHPYFLVIDTPIPPLGGGPYAPKWGNGAGEVRRRCDGVAAVVARSCCKMCGSPHCCRKNDVQAFPSAPRKRFTKGGAVPRTAGHHWEALGMIFATPLWRNTHFAKFARHLRRTSDTPLPHLLPTLGLTEHPLEGGGVSINK
jgi:hypothetical protein